MEAPENLEIARRSARSVQNSKELCMNVEELCMTTSPQISPRLEARPW